MQIKNVRRLKRQVTNRVRGARYELENWVEDRAIDLVLWRTDLTTSSSWDAYPITAWETWKAGALRRKRTKDAEFGAENAVRTDHGYTVKCINGTAPTVAQLASIARAVEKIETITGPLDDVFRWSGLTVVHTCGECAMSRFPLPRECDGCYDPQRRILCTGFDNDPSFAHEWAHWLDFETGWVASKRAAQWGEASAVYRARPCCAVLSEGSGLGIFEDAAVPLADQVADLANRARDLMSLPRIRPTRDLNYWKSHIEIWARLVEQYFAMTLPDPSDVVDPMVPQLVFNWRPSLWTSLEKDVAETLQAMLDFLRSRVATLSASIAA